MYITMIKGLHLINILPQKKKKKRKKEKNQIYFSQFVGGDFFVLVCTVNCKLVYHIKIVNLWKEICLKDKNTMD